MATIAAAHVDLHGGMDERTYRPQTLAEVRSGYQLGAGRLEIDLRDGEGFELAAVPQARRGVRESIIGRMGRAGGSAAARALPGGGTEVEIAIDREDRP